MIQDLIGFTAVFGLFIALPTIVVGGFVVSRFLKLKGQELALRREELELQKKKLEFLTAETNRELMDRLEREP